MVELTGRRFVFQRVHPHARNNLLPELRVFGSTQCPATARGRRCRYEFLHLRPALFHEPGTRDVGINLKIEKVALPELAGGVSRGRKNGRSDRIRTCDVLLPKQVL